MTSSASLRDHLKRAFSSRFCYIQNPLLSQYRIFTLSRRRLQNTNSCSENGSRRSASSTTIARPLMPFLKSTTSRHRYTAGKSFEGRIIPDPPPWSEPLIMSPYQPGPKTPPTCHSEIEGTIYYWHLPRLLVRDEYLHQRSAPTRLSICSSQYP